MKPLSLQMRKQIKRNLLVSACFGAVYLAMILIGLLISRPFGMISILETVGTLLGVTLFLHRLDTTYYSGILSFAAIAQCGGVMFGLYDVIPVYDLFLHGMSGVLLVLLGHYFLTLVTAKEKRECIPRSVELCFSWFFSIACAGLWEIVEFSLDRLFGFDSQLNSLVDTMTDIIMGSSGAVIGVLILWTLLKKGVLSLNK